MLPTVATVTIHITLDQDACNPLKPEPSSTTAVKEPSSTTAAKDQGPDDTQPQDEKTKDASDDQAKQIIAQQGSLKIFKMVEEMAH